MKPRSRRQNLFDFVPVIAPHISVETEGERIVIAFPRFRNKFLQRFLTPRNLSPLIRIRLDLHGSAVWNLIDGRRTVAQIAEALAARFDNQDGYEMRIASFIAQLQRQGYIELRIN
ncbi:MAG: PqqD family protein [Tannerellaceae bacterium]|jgi:hypothetical protein|nr:PqqD family protein [Tannerellaceae bacterium]